MNSIKYISIATAVIVFNQIIVITPTIGTLVYYLLILISLIAGLIHSDKLSLNPIMIWFLLVSLLSILLNDIPAFFNSPFRLLSFTVVVALVGPLLFSKRLSVLKLFIFKYLNLFIFFIATFSILLYLAGVSLGRNTGGFSGFFNHSMIMGPVAGIGLIVGFYRYYLYAKHPLLKKRTKPMAKWALIIALITMFLVLLLSSSRAALIATLAGLLFFFFKIYQKRITGFIAVVFVLLMSLTFTFPLWSDFTEGLAQKNTAIEESGDLLTARRNYWEARLSEFESSPLVGIGFATVSIDQGRADYNEATGGVEPGSSWLAILSMVGILGFIPIAIIFIHNLAFLIRPQGNALNRGLLGALLVFFITHMFAEGYFLSSGGFLFFYVWLLLGVIEVFRNTGEVVII